MSTPVLRALVGPLALLLALLNAAQAEPLLPKGSPESAQPATRFVVHGDLTGGERPGIFAAAAEQMRLLQPDFVISVGDLIEGDGDSAAGLHAQWEDYEERAARTGAPVYLVGGNHDLTSALQREVWAERYGPTYYHARVGDVLLLVLDSEDYADARRAVIASERRKAIAIAKTQGEEAYARTPYAAMPERRYGEIGEAQQRYFAAVLEEHADARWTFMFVHKAPWAGGNNEHFLALERALADRPYTVFHGHEHAVARIERQGREYVRLATTGGVQLADNGRAVDHVVLVTVRDSVTLASIDLAGLRDSSGRLPGNGGSLCFDTSTCSDNTEAP